MANQAQLRRDLALFQHNPAAIALPRAAAQRLKAECDRIYALMQSQPNRYTPSELEHAVFNAIANEDMKQNSRARQVVGRYHDTRQGKR
jgi:hypothetical protein